MKKFLFIAIIFGAAISFTSCGKDECVCDNGATITEQDAADSGVTLATACALAGVGGASCSIQ